MANAEVMRLAHDIDKKVEGVDEKVHGVAEQLLGVGGDVKVVEDKVQAVINGA